MVNSPSKGRPTSGRTAVVSPSCPFKVRYLDGLTIINNLKYTK